MNILYILMGAALLIFGRKYLWIFIAGIVYFITLEFIGDVLSDFPYVLLLFIALVFAASGAFFSSISNTAVRFLGSFLAGGYLFSLLAPTYVRIPGQVWVHYTVGGSLGLVLMAAESNWTLVVLSSLIGAIMVTRGISMKPNMLIVSFLAAALAGVIIQLLIMLLERPGRPASIGQVPDESEPGMQDNLLSK